MLPTVAANPEPSTDAFRIGDEVRIELPVTSSQPPLQPECNSSFDLPAQCAFPDDCDSPAGAEQVSSIALITLNIGVKFAFPESCTGVRRRCVRTPGMPVPETSMNKAHRAESTKHEIGSSGELSIVQAISEAACMERPAKNEFGARVPALDPCHHARSGCAINCIGHGLFRVVARTDAFFDEAFPFGWTW